MLKEKYGPNLNQLTSEKITIVDGDICLEDLGLQDFDLAHEMIHQVDAIVNLAATTKFDERYWFYINIVPREYVLQIIIFSYIFYIYCKTKGMLINSSADTM